MNIDENLIAKLVHTFYGRIRDDELLGPIFDARISDWDVHLPRMCSFWSSVMLRTGGFRGQPMRKHLPLPVDAKHFDRWLLLFEATAHDVCPPEEAAAFVGRARQIAQSLEMGIAASHGAYLEPGQRYHAPPTTPRRTLPITESETR